MFVLKYRDHFDAAHQLKSTPSLKTEKCLNFHGHRWEVEITLQAAKLRDGMVIDFEELKRIVKSYDHTNLNKKFHNPTAENIAQEICKRIKTIIREQRRNFITEIIVKISESPGNSVIFNSYTRFLSSSSADSLLLASDQSSQ